MREKRRERETIYRGVNTPRRGWHKTMMISSGRGQLGADTGGRGGRRGCCSLLRQPRQLGRRRPVLCKRGGEGTADELSDDCGFFFWNPDGVSQSSQRSPAGCRPRQVQPKTGRRALDWGGGNEQPEHSRSDRDFTGGGGGGD